MVTRWCWLGVLVCLPAVAQGTVLTFVMEGTVQSVSDPAGLLPAVQAGQRAVYTYSFESNAQDTDPTPFGGVYQGLTASLRIGSVEIPGAPPQIEVVPTPQRYQSQSFLDSGGLKGSTSFGLSLPQSQAISSDSLPQSPLDLSLFAGRMFSTTLLGPMVTYPAPEVSFSGYIDSFYAIPEPGTLLLMLPALFLWKHLPRRTP